MKVEGLVFSKDMVIVPIHCHGNHWTRECQLFQTTCSPLHSHHPSSSHTHTPAVAVINIRHKKFEYYDPMRGGEGMVLDNLRQWLQASDVSGRVSESVAAPSLGRDVNVSTTPPVPVAGRVARQDAEAD